MFKLRCTIIKLLEAMCEETHPGTQELVQNIHKTIKISNLQRTLVYFYTILKLKEDPWIVGFEEESILYIINFYYV